MEKSWNSNESVGEVMGRRWKRNGKVMETSNGTVMRCDRNV